MISVCMATYNGGKWLQAQLSSILSQLTADDELIISDDGSTDNTLDIIHHLDSPIVRLIEGPRSGSAPDNFEQALRAAKGDVIFLADQDDVWLPGKVEKMCAALQTGASCVVSDCYITDGELAVKHTSFFQKMGTKASRWYNLLVHNYYLGCCMAFKREVLERALPFPKGTPMHDIWIGNVAAWTGSVLFLPEQLIYYRRHSGNTSSAAEKSTLTLWQKCKVRYAIARALTQRLRKT